jgi:hypothetical protein
MVGFTLFKVCRVGVPGNPKNSFKCLSNFVFFDKHLNYAGYLQNI